MNFARSVSGKRFSIQVRAALLFFYVRSSMPMVTRLGIHEHSLQAMLELLRERPPCEARMRLLTPRLSAWSASIRLVDKLVESQQRAASVCSALIVELQHNVEACFDQFLSCDSLRIRHPLGDIGLIRPNAGVFIHHPHPAFIDVLQLVVSSA